MEGIIKWLSDWFASECDGDWEHENIITIKTVANPGWYITIDVKYTSLEDLKIETEEIRISDNDWYFYVMEEGQYRAGGDLQKLDLLLNQFKEIVELNNKQTDNLVNLP